MLDIHATFIVCVGGLISKSFSSSTRASKQKGKWDCRIKRYLKQRKNKNKIDLKKKKEGRKEGRTTVIKSKYETGRQGQLGGCQNQLQQKCIACGPTIYSLINGNDESANFFDGSL